MFSKNITLVIGNTEFPFEVKGDDYNRYQNELKIDDKVAPSQRFLKRSLIDKKQSDALNELCDQGLTLEIVGKLVEEFRPTVEIEVKK